MKIWHNFKFNHHVSSANDNNGENMASDNAFVLNEYHLRTNSILSSNSPETEGDFSHGQMSSIFMERPMCLNFATKG